MAEKMKATPKTDAFTRSSGQVIFRGEFVNGEKYEINAQSMVAAITQEKKLCQEKKQRWPQDIIKRDNT